MTVGLGLSLVCTVYNVLFGLRTPAVLLCQGDIRGVCMEHVTCGVDLERVRGPQVFLFSFSLCALLCFQSIALSALLRQLRLPPTPAAQPSVLIPEILNSSSQLDEAKLIVSLPEPAPLSEPEAAEVLSVESGVNRAVQAALIPPASASTQGKRRGRGHKK